jgi:hypothetical protein
VRNWFQAFAFKCSLYRYTGVTPDHVSPEAGLYKLPRRLQPPCFITLARIK